MHASTMGGACPVRNLYVSKLDGLKDAAAARRPFRVLPLLGAVVITTLLFVLVVFDAGIGRSV